MTTANAQFSMNRRRLLRVKSVGLALSRKLPVYPNEPTCSCTTSTEAMGTTGDIEALAWRSPIAASISTRWLLPRVSIFTSVIRPLVIRPSFGKVHDRTTAYLRNETLATWAERARCAEGGAPKPAGSGYRRELVSSLQVKKSLGDFELYCQ